MERDSERPAPIGEYLRSRHLEDAIAPILGSDEAGRFSSPWIRGLLTEPFVIVPDTVILRGDVGYACRNNRRTVLITAANTGKFRLVCAAHVVSEFERHAEEWAASQGLDYNIYLERWKSEYLRHLWVVPDEGLPETLLTPKESQRLETLRRKRSKDIPSVVLSLSIGGLYLTKDTDAWAAVYDKTPTPDELNKWLEPLTAGSNAGELATAGFWVSALPTAAIAGAASGARWLYERSPWLLVAAGVGAAFLASRVPKASYANLGSGLSQTATFITTNVYGPYHDYMQIFSDRIPRLPEWGEIGSIDDPVSALSRAALYHVVRRYDDVSAQELAEALPSLGIGQGAQRIREVLRGSPCFYETRRGRWQVGRITTGRF